MADRNETSAAQRAAKPGRGAPAMTRMRVAAWMTAAWFVLTWTTTPAAAQTTLEKVRAQGFVQCGSALRPGLAAVDATERWSGLEVEICRAVATAVLGKGARFAYHRYDADKDFDSVRAGQDQLSFLSFSEIVQQKLTDKLLLGPAVFIETHDLLVAADSPAKHLADLAGSSACFIIGTGPENTLDAWLADHHVELTRFAFQEEGEMYDAYAVQRCKAVAGESTALANARLDGGVNNLKSRLLPEHLATYPIYAATPLREDAQWAAIVAWTIHTLLAADQKESTHHAAGLETLAIDGAGLGLAPDWQKTVVATVGSYGDIFRRTLGEESPLKLSAGLNAPLEESGSLVIPNR